jgi:hypothetical protein
MYGDDEDEEPPMAAHRPLSFLSSPYEGLEQASRDTRSKDQQEERRRLIRSTSDKTAPTHSNMPNGDHAPPSIKKSQTLPARIPSQRGGMDNARSPMSPLSPTPSLREMQSDAASPFSLTNIENPNDIAQEISNLQALRRMSMDVGNTTDPDLLPFSGLSLTVMPSVAPQGDDDEADPSRLLWVPARVHPELEPTAFKNFLEKRVQTMKRRSGDSMLSADGRQSGSASLRRKKSMLSRQIANSAEGPAEGYVDGAERLERKLSQTGQGPELSLDDLVKDPTGAVQKLARESMTMEGGTQGDADDMPILPPVPGTGLRRSTRTTYRKGGSLRAGDRAPFSKRMAARNAPNSGDESSSPTSPNPPEAPKGYGLQRVMSEPVAENFSRPNRSVRRQQNFQRDSAPSQSSAFSETSAADEQNSFNVKLSAAHQDQVHTRQAPSNRPSAIPQIVETPPSEELSQAQSPPLSGQFPQRSSSSQKGQPSQYQPQEPEEPPPRSSKRPSPGRLVQPSSSAPLATADPPQAASPSQTFNDMVLQPSPLPGSGSTRTDSLTFIPTLTVEEKRDRRARETQEADSKPSGWKWFKSDDKDKKKKEKEREREKEEQAKKSKNKTFAEKAHDAARLDVLQTSIDTAVAKGRESLLLDRESIDNKLHEERKKVSNRKSSETIGSNGGKKEKDGFFGAIFSGAKRAAKGEKSESSGGKKGSGSSRGFSPEPPMRVLVPDKDYSWTRFSIIEERAIYRMAHIKLANPRRPLLSQVLLSNFMYSYLDKVQQMHPQLNVPISPQQKRIEEERRRKEEEERRLQLQQEGGLAADQYNYDYHRVSAYLGF